MLILLLIADLQGKIVDTVTWGDEKVVVTVDETKKGTGIYGYHFVKNKQLWRTQDGVFDCELDMTARYLKGTLAITDLDNDGVKESWFAYEVACRGDVSPTTIKLLMHEGEKKYAVRGVGMAPTGEGGKMEGGAATPDKELTGKFLDEAMKRFKAAVAESQK